MKKFMMIAASAFLLGACNNEGKDSVERADSINSEKTDDNGTLPQIAADEKTTGFLVDAANGGMTEVRLGELGQQKATNQKVKDYAAMLVSDHTGANNEVQKLAAQRNVTLPMEPGEANMKTINDLSSRSADGFDRAYMDEIIKDHEKDVKLFKDASDNVKDIEVKTFIDNTLPKLQKHLDDAQALRRTL